MGQVDVACPLGGFVLCLMWTSNVTAWLIYGVSEVILEANWSHWPVITRKLINTNGNIKGIFPLVNFREILPTEIFPQYIPRKLPWEKKLKQNKKNDDVSFLPTELPTKQIPLVIPSVNLLVNCEHCSSCQVQRESPTENSVGIVQIVNHWRIEKSSVLFGGFLKKFN